MVEKNESKVKMYLTEICDKINDLGLYFEGDLIPYLDYLKRKIDDFPEDVNYKEAVKRVCAKYR